jgi:ATPase subunit of ABC transporter with duplicated ATPase domains
VLVANALGVEVGGRLVVSGATFAVRARDKVGLVGRNGAGKTSLLRVLGGAAPSVAGSVQRTGGLGYLPQDPRIAGVLDGRTPVQHILSGRGLDEAMTRIEKLRAQMEEDPNELNVARFAKAEDTFRNDGGYAADAEVRSIAAGLGLGADRLDLPLSVLSGGERRRVELSRILFAGSDVLLLDEPTNHLDADAKTWLMKFLRGYRGALLVISHDLDLLDEAITRIIHLERSGEEGTGSLTEYKGTYSQYHASRARDEVRLAKVATAQAKEVARLQNLVDRFGAKASKASMAHSIEKRIVRIEAERVEGPQNDRAINVRFPPPPHSGRVTLEVEGLAKGYGGPPVFTDISFDVPRGERLLVLGLNGAGKTSLLRILAGETTADSGSFRFGHQVSAGYYAQEHEAGTGAARRRPAQPALARRAHQQPRSTEPRSGGRRPRRLARVHGGGEPRCRVRRAAGTAAGAAHARRRSRLLARGPRRPHRPCLSRLRRLLADARTIGARRHFAPSRPTPAAWVTDSLTMSRCR